MSRKERTKAISLVRCKAGVFNTLAAGRIWPARSVYADYVTLKMKKVLYIKLKNWYFYRARRVELCLDTSLAYILFEVESDQVTLDLSSKSSGPI
jgi:hypothetical protein